MDSAGASARREYERRRAAREAKARERHPRIGGFLLAINPEPQHQLSWKVGSEGEVQAAKRLEQLLSGTGVVLLHDRRMPRSRGNIDHLAVGPGGVTVIDTKRLTGKVEVRGRGARAELRVGGSNRSKLLEGVERQVAAVRAVAPDVDVRAALCFVDPSGLPLLRSLGPRRILVDGTKSVAKLARRPGRLTPAAIDDLVARLNAAFPSAAS